MLDEAVVLPGAPVLLSQDACSVRCPA